MAQAKRKTATRTAKRPATRSTKSCKKACTRTAKKREISRQEKMHVYIVTCMGIVAAILICANAAMMMA